MRMKRDLILPLYFLFQCARMLWGELNVKCQDPQEGGSTECQWAQSGRCLSSILKLKDNADDEITTFDFSIEEINDMTQAKGAKWG